MGIDPHGLARSSSLTGCSLRRGHDRYLTKPPEIHLVRPSLLDTWMPSCFSIREVHLGSMCMIQLWIRMTSVTCSTIGGSTPPTFWPIVPLVHWGISHFIWRFMDPHRLARSSSLTGCSLRREHDCYLTEPPRSIQLGSHFSTFGCHRASPSGRYILDLCAWFGYGFGWPVLHIHR